MSAPLTPGDQSGLTWGSVRWHIARGARLILDGGEHVDGDGSDAMTWYADLIAGRPVVVSRAQLEGFISEHDRTALDLPDVTAHEAWTLSGPSTLVPA